MFGQRNNCISKYRGYREIYVACFTRSLQVYIKNLKVKVELLMTVTLKNEIGALKTAPTGFSWTMLFFGCFVPLFRGDFKWFFISLCAAFISFGISWLIMPFIYNKKYLGNLLEMRFMPSDEASKNKLVSLGLFSSNSQIAG